MKTTKALRFNKENGFETTKERSHLMKKIKSTNTKPELLLRRRLWSEGFRYRVNSKKLPGRPDILFVKKKIAVFVDGSFWHGYNWESKRDKLKTNREFWLQKIERNMERDKENNEKLKYLGWQVIRFWDHDVEKNIEACIQKVKEAYQKP